MIESGKWIDPAFPRTGWTFWTGKDHGVRDRRICEACEAQSVRFAYHLSHDACGLLSVGECCASRLCPDRADAIAATGRKLRADAEELDGRTVTVEGTGYLTGQGSWGLPNRSPLLEPGWYTRLTILSRPAPERVTVDRVGCTHVLRLCDHGDDVWLCGAVRYCTNPLNGSADFFGARCRFVAVLLRDRDMEAVRRLCGQRPEDYTLLLKHSFRPELAEWVRVGPATWKPSVSFIAEGIGRVLSEDGRLEPEKILRRECEYPKELTLDDLEIDGVL